MMLRIKNQYYDRRILYALYTAAISIFFWSTVSCEENENRTAVIISGQLRTGNSTCADGILMPSHQPCITYFSMDIKSSDGFAYNTPIGTQLLYLILPLSRQGGVDVFLFAQTTSTFQETADEICNLYSRHSVFNSSSGNNIFCFQDTEEEELPPFVESSSTDIWYTYQFGYRVPKMKTLIRQLYGLYRGNEYSKQHSIHREKEYTFKVRLRPDTAFFAEIPRLEREMFINKENEKIAGPFYPTSIQYPNCKVFGNCETAAQDSFNFGISTDMDHYFDRYIDMTQKPFLLSPFKNYKWWNSESWMEGLMNKRYNVSLDMNDDFKAFIVRHMHEE